MHKNRKKIRLKHFDYSTPGYYFVTICTNKRINLFGRIKDGNMKVFKSGKIIQKWWNELENKFSNIALGEFILMPNHLHGIIIVTANLNVRPQEVINATLAEMQEEGHTGPSLQEVVQWFKTMTTNEYIRNVKEKNWIRFDKRLWQRSFYDHVIRDERSLNNIREYIQNNIREWEEDIENPTNRYKKNRQGYYLNLFNM